MHMVLPVLSIVLSALGFWALGMRAMMVSVQNDDYVQFAEAKGLKGRTVFYRYAARNALLPQVTALGLTIGYILSGALLVEIVFSYPGIGNVLYRSIKAYDYFAIEGIVFGVIVSITLATLMLDLLYPKIDPRINYAKSYAVADGRRTSGPGRHQRSRSRAENQLQGSARSCLGYLTRNRQMVVGHRDARRAGCCSSSSAALLLRHEQVQAAVGADRVGRRRRSGRWAPISRAATCWR